MIRHSTLAALLLSSAAPALAEGELNLYSSRHYDTDERLYTDFEEMTGITINRIEGKADELIERIKAVVDPEPLEEIYERADWEAEASRDLLLDAVSDPLEDIRRGL